jgi:hypothetical protein
VKKLEKEWREEREGRRGQPNLEGNIAATLANEAMRLKSEVNMKRAFLEKLRVKVKDNLAEKNKLLASRVE